MATKKPKVTIRREKGDGYEPVSVEVLLDGKPIAEGGMGGEPEDNCEARDWAWVLPCISKLARKLGADVETIETEPED
jgi:hypothetical protein